MQIHALDLNDFHQDQYNLIGIHTTLEDFKLAYLLNNSFKTQFKRASFSLDFKNKEGKVSFSVFDYINKKYDFEWYLISNSYADENASMSNSLLFSTETKHFLIPEKKRVDYLLKIVGEADYDYIQKCIERLNKIPQVITSYAIDHATLKSKDYLIF